MKRKLLCTVGLHRSLVGNSCCGAGYRS